MIAENTPEECENTILRKLEEIHSGIADLASALLNADPDSEVNVRGLGLALETQRKLLQALLENCRQKSKGKAQGDPRSVPSQPSRRPYLQQV